MVKKPLAGKPREKKAQLVLFADSSLDTTTTTTTGTTDQATGSALGQAYPPAPFHPFQHPTPPHLPPPPPFSRSPHDTSHRPAKRARTDSHSQDLPHAPAQGYDDSSFAWTPGLSIGSFGDPGAGDFEEGEFGRRGRSRSGGRDGPGDLFGMGFGHAGPSQQQQRTEQSHHQRSGGEPALQPFVPNFSGFSVGKTDDRGYGRHLAGGFGTQGQGQGQSQGQAYPSTMGQPGAFYVGPSRQGYSHQDGPTHQRPSSASQGPSAQPGRPFPSGEFTTHDAATGKIPNTPLPPCPQIEDVTTWSSISFFISLHLRYQHCIMPILHKPTFNSDLALRLDRKDEQFRAFLLSLGKFSASHRVQR